jgi:hypothetical protein
VSKCVIRFAGDMKCLLKCGDSINNGNQDMRHTTAAVRGTPCIVNPAVRSTYIPRTSTSVRILENRMLRAICGPGMDEGTGEWRRLHDKELRNVYSSPNIIRVIISRRMRWAKRIAHMG